MFSLSGFVGESMYKYTQEDLDETREFLNDYLQCLQEREPHALVCINSIQGALNSLPDEIEEVIGSE